MRTTVTLEPDVVQIVKRLMDERQLSFKGAINEAIRSGAAVRTPPRRFEVPTASLGQPTVNLDRALQLAGELEDEELLRRMRKGS